MIEETPSRARDRLPHDDLRRPVGDDRPPKIHVPGAMVTAILNLEIDIEPTRLRLDRPRRAFAAEGARAKR